ncbi:MAG: divergent polysaccharide deacetylase family protein [Treponema sp.]|nr:divergent polysaccharide deacetylase family protein [Treponema sp.]
MVNSTGGKKRRTTKNNSSPAKKKSNSTKRKSSKKPKVYIPKYKAFILCAGVIAVCVLLLLTANIIQTKKNQNKNEAPSITQRFEDNKDSVKSDTNKSDSKKKDSSKSDSQKGGKNQTASNKNDNSKNDNLSQNKNDKTSTNTSSKNETLKSENTIKDSSKSETENQQTTKSDTKSSNNQNEIKPRPDSEIASIKIDNKNEVEKPSSKFNFPAAVNKAQLIFVFDDGGQNISHLNKFLELPFPITVAVLPQLAHSKESAELIRKSGNEVILHQPMQSINANINPGPGAITPQMGENEIISTLFQNINEIGPIEGMNNHEGSAITADAEKMATILKIASENGIFFLDSRTNVETKVPYVAHELGYSWYERNIFLDNEKTRENALKELNKGLALANKNGSVIMIGHIWSADFLPAFLKEAYPELLAKGYTFSLVSKSKAKKW